MLKRLFFPSLFFLCQCACIGTRNKDISKVNVIYKLPFLVTADSAGLSVDSGSIYTYGKYRVYEVRGAEDDFTNGQLTHHAIRSAYMGYDTAMRFGYYATSLTDTFQKVKIDSFMNYRPNGKWLHSLLVLSPAIKDVRLSPTELVRKCYISDPGLDSAYLYFNSAFKSIPYTLYPEQDSACNSKLFKIEVWIKKDNSKNAAQLNQYRKVSLEINQDMEVKNKAQIVDFIQKVALQYKEKNDHTGL